MDKRFAQALTTLKHSKSHQIPKFSQQSIQLAKQQIAKLTSQMKKLNELMKNSSEATQQQQVLMKGKLALMFDQIYRIKRFLLVYHNQRLNKIEEQFWDFGGDIKNQEKNYFIQYKDLTMRYIDKVGVDLTTDLDPPLFTQVQVTFLQDCGQFIDQNGQTQKLQKNSGFFMKKKLVETFVKQGYAKIHK